MSHVGHGENATTVEEKGGRGRGGGKGQSSSSKQEALLLDDWRDTKKRKGKRTSTVWSLIRKKEREEKGTPHHDNNKAKTVEKGAGDSWKRLEKAFSSREKSEQKQKRQEKKKADDRRKARKKAEEKRKRDKRPAHPWGRSQSHKDVAEVLGLLDWAGASRSRATLEQRKAKSKKKGGKLSWGEVADEVVTSMQYLDVVEESAQLLRPHMSWPRRTRPEVRKAVTFSSCANVGDTEGEMEVDQAPFDASAFFFSYSWVGSRTATAPAMLQSSSLGVSPSSSSVVSPKHSPKKKRGTAVTGGALATLREKDQRSLQTKTNAAKRMTGKFNQPVDSILFKLQPIFEGYLFYKRKRRWVILDANNLYLFKSVQDYGRPKIVPLRHSSARKHTKEGHHGIEVVTPGENFLFFVDKEAGAGEMVEQWASNIHKVCENLVMAEIGGSEQHNLLTRTYSRLLSKEEFEQEQEEHQLPSTQRAAMRLAMLPENSTCADCGAAGPEWASINLGVFICIECSGIHRSFGTHISKVRSVKLDNWEADAVEVMRSIGNAAANEEWEAAIPPTATPIAPSANLEERKQWLQRKYVDGEFRQDREAWQALQVRKRMSPTSTTSTAAPAAAPRREESGIAPTEQMQHIQDMARNVRKEALKSVLLQLLREDVEFREEVRTILGKEP